MFSCFFCSGSSSISGSFFSLISFTSSSDVDFFLSGVLTSERRLESFPICLVFFFLISSSYGVGSKSGSESGSISDGIESGERGFNEPLGLRRFDGLRFGESSSSTMGSPAFL